MTRVLSLICVLVLALAGCGGDDDEGGGDGAASDRTVTIGSKNFTEAIVLGELYTQALEAKGFTVELKSSIGSTEMIDKALRERPDRLVSRVHGHDADRRLRRGQATQEDAEATYDRAKELYEERG